MSGNPPSCAVKIADLRSSEMALHTRQPIKTIRLRASQSDERAALQGEDINRYTQSPHPPPHHPHHPNTPPRLLDVREPSEHTSGNIPTSLNIPIKSSPDALFLPAEEFEDKFGFAKPSPDAEVVFYCKSGVRSRAAAELARQGGYDKVGEYAGSWLDWEKNLKG